MTLEELSSAIEAGIAALDAAAVQIERLNIKEVSDRLDTLELLIGDIK